MGLESQNFYKIDYDAAREFYPGGMFKTDILQNKYGPAFLTSNELLRESIPAYGRIAQGDVLTVAASGDQAFMYAALGAKSVDTFDMTFSAKAVMDMKMVVMQQMSYEQYIQFIKNVAVTQPRKMAPMDLLSVNGMAQVIEKMPLQSAEYIQQMRGCNIFSFGANRLSFPTADEYAKMKEAIKEPFNFAWTDIDYLHWSATEQYDIINISNILEWVDDVWDCCRILSNLFWRLKKDGYILACAFKPKTGVTEGCFRYTWERYIDKSWFESSYVKWGEGLCVLQRTR